MVQTYTHIHKQYKPNMSINNIIKVLLKKKIITNIQDNPDFSGV